MEGILRLPLRGVVFGEGAKYWGILEFDGVFLTQAHKGQLTYVEPRVALTHAMNFIVPFDAMKGLYTEH